jgi:hypothetical protein
MITSGPINVRRSEMWHSGDPLCSFVLCMGGRWDRPTDSDPVLRGARWSINRERPRHDKRSVPNGARWVL